MTAAKQWQYRIYGLKLCLDRPLTGVPQAMFDAPADVHLRFQSGAGTIAPLPNAASAVDLPPNRRRNSVRVHQHGSDTVFDFALPALGQIRLRINGDQSEVFTTLADEVSDQDLTSFVVGALLGCVLRQRGVVCLHGSAVLIDEQAVLVIGQRGSGKSTTAAGLTLLQGGQLLADDIAALTEIDGVPHVQPGYPGLRLNGDVLRKIANPQHPADNFVLSRRRDKRYVRVPPSTAGPSPIAAMFVLRQTEAPDHAVLAPQDALLTLIQNGFAMQAVTSPALVRAEVDMLTRLLRQVPLRALHRHQGLARLDHTAQQIINRVRVA